MPRRKKPGPGSDEPSSSTPPWRPGGPQPSAPPVSGLKAWLKAFANLSRLSTVGCSQPRKGTKPPPERRLPGHPNQQPGTGPSPVGTLGCLHLRRSESSAAVVIQASVRGAKEREVLHSHRGSVKGGPLGEAADGGEAGPSALPQAGGHAGTFKRDPDDPDKNVVKEGTANERVIYEALQEESLRAFTPSYHGATERGAITLLRLGDVTAGCVAPCVMDLKLGTPTARKGPPPPLEDWRPPGGYGGPGCSEAPPPPLGGAPRPQALGPCPWVEPASQAGRSVAVA